MTTPSPSFEPTATERRVEQYTTTDAASSSDTGATPYGNAAADLGLDRRSVVGRQEERFGGIKLGSSFFGWVTAIGIAVLLLALLTATGVALGLTNGTSAAEINKQAAAATGTAKTVGLVGGIALLVVLFIAYFCGGYVAARMARFNGAKQGMSVWLWGLLIIGIIALLAVIFGSKFNILASLNLPRIPVDEGTVTAAGIISIVAALAVTLGAALLGGRAGMRFHHRVDRVGLGS